MADQSGYAVLAAQQPATIVKDNTHFGGGAVWILVWVVVIIIILALLAAVFCGGDWFNNDNVDSDDRKSRKKCDWNLNWLGGLVVFIVVILFLCWLLGAAGGYNR